MYACVFHKVLLLDKTHCQLLHRKGRDSAKPADTGCGALARSGRSPRFTQMPSALLEYTCKFLPTHQGLLASLCVRVSSHQK